MEKEILFLWFGDNEPKYANYTIENFRQINPTWNIKYITYSNQDLINYKLQNDSILEYSIDTIFKTRKYRHNSFLCDIYINMNTLDKLLNRNMQCIAISIAFQLRLQMTSCI